MRIKNTTFSNKFYVFLYILSTFITTQIIIYIIFSKKNLEFFVVLKSILPIFSIDSVITWKKETTYSIFEYFLFYKNAILHTYSFFLNNTIKNMFIVYINAIVFSICKIIMGFVHQIILIYRVYGSFVYTIFGIFFCIWWFWTLIIYEHWIGKIFRVYYYVKNNYRFFYKDEDVEIFWTKTWTYYIERSCFLILIYLMLHIIFYKWNMFYWWLPRKKIWTFSYEWRAFDHSLLEWKTLLYDTNLMYMRTSDIFVGNKRILYPFTPNYFWL